MKICRATARRTANTSQCVAASGSGEISEVFSRPVMLTAALPWRTVRENGGRVVSTQAIVEKPPRKLAQQQRNHHADDSFNDGDCRPDGGDTDEFAEKSDRVDILTTKQIRGIEFKMAVRKARTAPTYKE